jgi:hypothetical protein
MNFSALLCIPPGIYYVCSVCYELWKLQAPIVDLLKPSIPCTRSIGKRDLSTPDGYSRLERALIQMTKFCLKGWAILVSCIRDGSLSVHVELSHPGPMCY